MNSAEAHVLPTEFDGEVWGMIHQVRRLVGNPSDMTIHRWVNDKDLAFPQPIYIRGKRFWKLREITSWLDTRARGENDQPNAGNPPIRASAPAS